jgi:hypothetical protein
MGRSDPEELPGELLASPTLYLREPLPPPNVGAKEG